MEPKKAISDMLQSISGVLIFLSLAYWIDLNGFTIFSPLLILFGVLLLIYPKPFSDLLPLGFINEAVILTVAHILIFLGSMVYLLRFIEQYWILYLVLGIILINMHKTITDKLFNKG
jgi:hypothetical protein